jgi:hypothetical protein
VCCFTGFGVKSIVSSFTIKRAGAGFGKIWGRKPFNDNTPRAFAHFGFAIFRLNLSREK